VPHPLRSWSLRLLALPACALALTACSSSPSPSSSSSTTTTTAGRTTTTTPSSNGTSTTSRTSGTLAPQTADTTEFYSPSKNISCEIDFNFTSSMQTDAFCLTYSSPKSVTLMTDSTLKECTGTGCLANAGVDTPTLAYGQTVSLGPFTCASSTAGVKCALANGDGFLISSSATTALGNAKVVAGSG
jgi:hypothetical protein